MATNNQNDLRKGKSGAEPTTNAKLAGHGDSIMPMPKSGEQIVIGRGRLNTVGVRQNAGAGHNGLPDQIHSPRIFSERG